MNGSRPGGTPGFPDAQPPAQTAGPGTSPEPRHARRVLTVWQRIAVGVNVAGAVAVGGYGAVASYTNVTGLAARHHVHLWRLVPAGIDGGLLLVVLTDIVLTWIGRPVGWLRAAARLFVAGTVAANAAAGWPDPVAVFLDCFPPLILLLVVEAARVSMLRAHTAAEGRDPVPLTRWLAGPATTLALRRRMALWGITSYSQAVATEVARRQAIIKLEQHYGRSWRRDAPADLVWLLRTGNKITEAFARAETITAPEPAGTRPGPRPRRGGSSGNRGRNRGRSASGNRRVTSSGNRAPANGSRPGAAPSTDSGNPVATAGSGLGTVPMAAAASDPAAASAAGSGNPAEAAELLAQARQAATAHRARTGRMITATELASAMGRRKATAAPLLRQLKAEAGATGLAAAALAEVEQ